MCMEQIKKIGPHPVLKPGVTVQIGLGKSTRLESVFERYVKICKNRDPSHRPVSVSDLEFVHALVLKGSETVEQAALMKDDRIRVRAERSVINLQERERAKVQRDSDLVFFQQMKTLLKPDLSSSNDLVYLDCRGQLPIGGSVRGRPMPCIVSLVGKRCPWLRRQIDFALADEKPTSVDRKAYDRTDSWSRRTSSRDTSPRGEVSEEPDRSVSRDEEEEDMPIEMVVQNENAQAPAAAAARAEIAPDTAIIQSEGDDCLEDETIEEVDSKPTVVIPDHPPQAMVLLLEYCYTNRVPSLGVEAFKASARTRLAARDFQGNIPPYTIASAGKRWPSRGEPTVNFHTALACLELAEEAGLPRLSLMCEVAAAQLVHPSNVMDALTLCGRMKSETGNELSRLRQAAMDIVLHGKRNIADKNAFRNALEADSKLLVPTLLQGLVQTLDQRMDRRQLHEYENRDWQATAYAHFDHIDRDDDYKRARERRQRRIERHPEGEQAVVVDEFEAMATRRPTKKARRTGTSLRSVLRQPEKRNRRNSH